MQTRSQAKLSNPPSTSTRQTKPAKAKKVNSSSKIDRLSNLPNELLDLIFDYAYPLESPSTGPLSKHLLPYHITGLYRRVELQNPDAIIEFVQKIIEEPELGSLVKCAHLTTVYEGRTDEDWVSEKDTHEFFSNLDNLQELNLGDRFHEAFGHISQGDLDLIPSGYLPSLQHLEIAGVFDIRHFTRYRSLVSLDITGDHETGDSEVSLDWNRSKDLAVDPYDNLPRLSKLKSLRIKNLRLDHPQLLPYFLTTMPNLVNLKLYGLKGVRNWEGQPWLETIAKLPPHLASQAQATAALEDEYDEYDEDDEDD